MTARTAYAAYQNQEKYDESALDWLMTRLDTPFIVPVIKDDSRTQMASRGQYGRRWRYPRTNGMPVDPVMDSYNRMSKACRADQPADFNAAVQDYQTQIAGLLAPEMKKMRSEQFFNFFEPFYKGMTLDLCVIFCWCWRIGFIRCDGIECGKAAIGLVCLALYCNPWWADFWCGEWSCRDGRR